MIKLSDEDIRTLDRQSSKGNQLKFLKDGYWYKADYLGYEGLAEFVVSKLLAMSNLKPEEYTNYELETIEYNNAAFNGCKSRDFLNGKQLITLERLFKQTRSESLHGLLFRTEDHVKRFKTLVELTQGATGIADAGEYFCKLLLIDAFFLNEDRHTHNIAVLMDSKDRFSLCPVFDNGAALLSDTRMDYPMGGDINEMMRRVKSATFTDSFDEQLDIVESLYPCKLRFRFKYADVEKIVNSADNYDAEIRKRVIDLVMYQRKKYECYFE